MTLEGGCHNCSDGVCRHVLNNRSDLCRARHDSGMRDAEDNQLHVPEHFAKVCLHTPPPPFLQHRGLSCMQSKAASGALRQGSCCCNFTSQIGLAKVATGATVVA